MAISSVQFEKFKSLLSTFVSYKTVSTDASFKPEINECVSWLSRLFNDAGFKVVFEGKKCNPIIIARKEIDPSYPTVLVYGHYDVQPAATIDGWLSDPFTLVERDNKLYARGVVDNKGQILSHVFSVLGALESGTLKKNVCFVIEGNEETGGEELSLLVCDKKELFSCNQVLISDGEIPYSPMMEASFRGAANIEVTVSTANVALHSGLYGGAVASASEEMIRLLSTLKDSSGRVAVAGFYDGDITPSSKQISDCKKLDKLRVSLLSDTGVKKVAAQFSSTTAFSSMLEVSGLFSGYCGQGFSNIVPHNATAKINIRFAGKSDPKKVIDLVVSHLQKHKPGYVTLSITLAESFPPVFIDVTTPLHMSVSKLLENVYGKKVSINYCGASIPIVSQFVDVLGVQPLMIPLGNDDCNMHAVNENYDIELLKKGLEFSERFFTDAH